MRGTACSPVRCAALSGEPGVDAQCSIHGRHPGCCREVAVGSRQCAHARELHGMPALTAGAIAAAYGAANPPARDAAPPEAAGASTRIEPIQINGSEVVGGSQSSIEDATPSAPRLDEARASGTTSKEWVRSANLSVELPSSD